MLDLFLLPFLTIINDFGEVFYNISKNNMNLISITKAEHDVGRKMTCSIDDLYHNDLEKYNATQNNFVKVTIQKYCESCFVFNLSIIWMTFQICQSLFIHCHRFFKIRYDLQ